MSRRVPSALFLIASALTIVGMTSFVRSMLPQAAPDRPKPLAVELIEPDRASPARPTRGMVIGHDGFGTVLSAPGRRLSPSSAAGPRRAATPVPGQVAASVRLLTRLAAAPSFGRLTTTMEAIPSRFGVLILRDGCLRLAGDGEPHAIMPPGTTLTIDDGGYLTADMVNDAAMNPRIGEAAWWLYGPDQRVDAGAVARIRATCGPGAVRFVGLAQSVTASQAAADDGAARLIVDQYGLTRPAALAAVRRCRMRLARDQHAEPLIANPCGTTPPLPVADPRSCPAGTRLSGGLCRTPAGYIRPIPAF